MDGDVTIGTVRQGQGKHCGLIKAEQSITTIISLILLNAVFELQFDFVISAYTELRSLAAWRNNTQAYKNLLTHLSHAKNSLELLP